VRQVRSRVVFEITRLALIGVWVLRFQAGTSAAQETPTEDGDSAPMPNAESSEIDDTQARVDLPEAESVDARPAPVPKLPSAVPAHVRVPAPTPTQPPLPRKAPPTKPAVTHGANEIVVRLMVEPPGIAHVYWGVKDVGIAPVELVRPRDSGPMDLIVRAPGYLNFHTRAYTDRDDKIAIRLVLQAEAPRPAGLQATEPLASKNGSTKASARDPKGKQQKKK